MTAKTDENEMITKTEPKWMLMTKIIIAIMFPLAGGLIGAVFSMDNMETWYPTLEKPSWSPPTWSLTVISAILYALVGIASYLVYRFGGGLKGSARWCLLIYLINLVLNWSWQPVFFCSKNIFAGFVLIICVLATAIIEASAFGAMSLIAGALVLPYIAWLVVLTAINGWIYLNNI